VQRFVLRYRGKGDPSGVHAKLRELGASIVEDSGRMLLVETPNASLKDALASERDWLVVPEVTYERPDTRQSVK
jgi:hypothetical protein